MCSLKPLWIVVENVKGFLTSNCLKIWKDSLLCCGYVWRQYLLSPLTAVGTPNRRMRYYMIAEHGSSPYAYRLYLPPHVCSTKISSSHTDETCQEADLTSAKFSKNFNKLSSLNEQGECEGCLTYNNHDTSTQGYSEYDFIEECRFNDCDSFSDSSANFIAKLQFLPSISSVYFVCEGDLVCTALPQSVASHYPSRPRTIGETIENATSSLTEEEIQSLVIPTNKLLQNATSRLISIVQLTDCDSRCVTKSYGKMLDQSVGSLLLMELDWRSILVQEQWCLKYDNNLAVQVKNNICGTQGINTSQTVSTSQLQAQASTNSSPQQSYTDIRLDDLVKLRPDLFVNSLRKFHPKEILALLDFPSTYSLPSELTPLQIYGCIGNSVNVEVVRSVMTLLFDSNLCLDAFN